MSIEGILLQPGEAQGVSLRGTQVDFLVTAEHAKGCSVFEFSVARASIRAPITTPRSRRSFTSSKES